MGNMIIEVYFIERYILKLLGVLVINYSLNVIDVKNFLLVMKVEVDEVVSI